MGSAFRKAGLFSALLAMFVASGGHLMALQSVAWTQMLMGNLRTETLRGAIDKTFDGKHLCGLCHQIQSVREKENRPDSAITSDAPSPRLWMAVAGLSVRAPDRSPFIAARIAVPVPDGFVGQPPDPPPRTV